MEEEHMDTLFRVKLGIPTPFFHLTKEETIRR